MGQSTTSFGVILSAMLVAGAQSAQALPTGPLYIDDSAGNIGTVNIGTGVVTLLGNAGVVLTDIGFTANGNLYGTSFDSFFAVNKTNGAATLISSYGGVGGNGINALVGAGAGLYAASNVTTALYAIGVSPFTISTLSGSTGGGSAGDLAFAMSGGALYETRTDGTLAKITISGNSITSTTVGNTGNASLFGLATGDDGATYAVGGTEIYSVNLTTATLTPLLNYSGHGLMAANGTAFVGEGSIPVPEPASFSLLGAGLIAAQMFRKRRVI